MVGNHYDLWGRALDTLLAETKDGWWLLLWIAAARCAGAGNRMLQLAFGLIAVWFFGLVFFAARTLNLTRLVLNNLVAGERYLGSAHVNLLGAAYRLGGTAVDPAQLTDLGREYHKKAIRNQRLMICWGICGFLLSAGLLSYAQG